MCGIVAYWARESVLRKHEYDILFKEAEKRGQDGIGITILSGNYAYAERKWVGPYSKHKEEVLEFVHGYMNKGFLLLASFRATPETEPTTDIDMIQPIRSSDMFLIHNGGVTDSVKKEFQYKYSTPIDSEAIIAAFILNNHNMVAAMEDLSGSFSAVMYSCEHQRLYTISSFLPIAHSYIRGYGYIIHSDNNALRKLVYHLTGAARDGMNVWESWYHHDIEGYTIIETDMDSGMQTKHKYKPRFLHPKWDSIAPYGFSIKTAVVASGGIDSGLTAALLHLGGRDITMLHFDYGQKSASSEQWAIRQLSKYYGGIPYLVIDLKPLYAYLTDPSMLLERNIEVTSGGDDIKSTIAWVAGRNTIFASIAMAWAETAILNWDYKQVDIAAGWNQLSEETGGYPDNSYKFNRALEELKDYGYITGHRINFLPVLRNLTKTECWKIGDIINFPFHLTVSCDNPKLAGQPILCQECGSTKLSIIAADRAGVEDKRSFIGERKKLAEPVALPRPQDLFDRLILDSATRQKLKERFLPPAMTVDKGQPDHR